MPPLILRGAFPSHPVRARLPDNPVQAASACGQVGGSAGRFLMNNLKKALARRFTLIAGLRTDSAMLHGRMHLAFRPAGSGGPDAGCKLQGEDVGGGLRLAGYDPSGHFANIGAVQVQSDAAHKVIQVRLTQAGIRTIRAGLRAIETGADARLDLVDMHAGTERVRLQHLR